MVGNDQRLRTSWLTFSMFVLLGFGHSSFGQASRTWSTLDQSMTAVQDRFHVAIGVEMAGGDPDKDPISLDLSGSDPARAFEQIVAQRPQYRWSLQDGAYVLYAANDRSSVLDVSIASYSVKNLSVDEASDALSKLPEVQQWLGAHNVRRRELEAWGSHAPKDRISVSLTGVKLRDVLNAIAAQSTRKRWTVIRYGETMQYLAIYF